MEPLRVLGWILRAGVGTKVKMGSEYYKSSFLKGTLSSWKRGGQV